jgi:hypothetical protein
MARNLSRSAGLIAGVLLSSMCGASLTVGCASERAPAKTASAVKRTPAFELLRDLPTQLEAETVSLAQDLDAAIRIQSTLATLQQQSRLSRKEILALAQQGLPGANVIVSLPAVKAERRATVEAALRTFVDDYQRLANTVQSANGQLQALATKVNATLERMPTLAAAARVKANAVLELSTATTEQLAMARAQVVQIPELERDGERKLRALIVTTQQLPRKAQQAVAKLASVQAIRP